MVSVLRIAKGGSCLDALYALHASTGNGIKSEERLISLPFNEMTDGMGAHVFSLLISIL